MTSLRRWIGAESRNLPVVKAGKVVGMISRFELIAALERSLSRNETI